MTMYRVARLVTPDDVLENAWFQVVSVTAWARSRSVGNPHLQEAHWMISSVVPVKFPVTSALCPL